MNSLLSVPVFVTGPDDKLATADLYKATGDLINEIRDISDTFKSTSLDALKGGNTLLENVKNTLVKDFESGLQGIKLDTDSLIKGLISTNPGMISALRSLPTNIQTELTKVNGFSEIAGTLGGISSEISKANLTTVTGLATLINGISGANLPFNFTDKNALAQLSVNLIIQASRVGIKGAIKPFIDNITDKRVLRGIVAGVASQAISNNMTDLLKDIATSTIGRTMVKTVGGLALQIMQGYATEYKSPVDRRYTKYSNTALLLTAFNIAWREYTRGDTVAIEANYMVHASNDFISDVYLAASRQTNNIVIPPNPSTINTAIGTSTEAYMYLIGPSLNTTPRADLSQKFRYVYFN